MLRREESGRDFDDGIFGMSDIADRLSPSRPVSGAAVAAFGLSDVSPVPSGSRLARCLWVGAVNGLFTLLSLPTLLAATIALLVLNPRYNPGPLFFVQQRVGRGGRVFRIYKFRTMAVAPAGSSTSIQASEVRITRLGRVLRKFRIDELPNFINVLLGDMNVIGPRPDATEQAQIYVRTVDGYRDRFDVKPGITGLAQVVQGYAACANSTRKKVRYDRYYVRRRSARMDLFVVTRTIQVMLTGVGSR